MQDNSNPFTAIDAEADLIGGCLFNMKAALLVVDRLKPEHFLDDLHRAVWQKIVMAAQEGRVASPAEISLSLALTAEQKHVLASYAARGLMLLDPRGIAEAIIEAHAKRTLAEVCRATLTALDDGTDRRAAEIKAELDSGLFAYERQCGEDGFASDGSASTEIMNHMRRDDRAFSTGLKRLDSAMDGGLYPGYSYAFCARKKVGKTILAGTISGNLSDAGVKHLFMCGEMGYRDIHGRILAHRMGVPASSFRLRTHDTAFMARIVGEAEKAKGGVVYKNIQHYTLDQVIQTVTSAIYRFGITGFILDYWQLVRGNKRGQNQAEHLDQVAQWIADFCRKHGLWSVTMAQINQEGNTRGGEGLRLAVDQAYEIMMPEQNKDVRWLNMIETRYTEWATIGSEFDPYLRISKHGLVFEECEPTHATYSAERR